MGSGDLFLDSGLVAGLGAAWWRGGVGFGDMDRGLFFCFVCFVCFAR